MLKQEFESRTGLTVSEDRFQKINDFYMQAVSLDKDTFCANFIEGMEENPIIVEILRRLNVYETAFDSHVSQREQVGKNLLDIANTIENKEIKTNVESVSWMLLTRKDYTLYKITKGYKLDDSDIEYLKHNLE